MARYEVIQTIGAPVVYINDDNGCEVARMTLPREVMEQIAFYALRDIIHNGTDAQRTYIAEHGITF